MIKVENCTGETREYSDEEYIAILKSFFCQEDSDTINIPETVTEDMFFPATEEDEQKMYELKVRAKKELAE